MCHWFLQKRSGPSKNCASGPLKALSDTGDECVDSLAQNDKLFDEFQKFSRLNRMLFAFNMPYKFIMFRYDDCIIANLAIVFLNQQNR